MHWKRWIGWCAGMGGKVVLRTLGPEGGRGGRKDESGVWDTKLRGQGEETSDGDGRRASRVAETDQVCARGRSDLALLRSLCNHMRFPSGSQRSARCPERSALVNVSCLPVGVGVGVGDSDRTRTHPRAASPPRRRASFASEQFLTTSAPAQSPSRPLTLAPSPA